MAYSIIIIIHIYRVLYSLQSLFTAHIAVTNYKSESHIERTCSNIVFADSLHLLFINSYFIKFLILFLKDRILFAHLGKIQCNSNQRQMNALIKKCR